MTRKQNAMRTERAEKRNAMNDRPSSHAAAQQTRGASRPAGAVVYSFDVFDTVLTRTVSPPTAVFRLVAMRAGRALPGAVTPGQFAALRRRAEQRAVAWHGDGTTLEHIYRELQDSLDLTAEAARRIREAELEAEQEVLCPVPKMQSVLRRLRAQGASVLFVSDMYLPASYIQSRLAEHGLWQPGDRLYVSCEHGETKATGKLLQTIQDDLGADGPRIVHTGNSQFSDIDGARKAGVAARHRTAANPNRYEAMLGRSAHETAGLSTLLAGASRYARLHTKASAPREPALRDVAAGVMAPVLTGFVLWMLRHAQERGLEQLYFTSRDGQVLLPIARRLAPVLGVSCALKYVHLSRVALTAARPKLDTLPHTWDFFETAGGEDLLARLNLSIDDIASALPSDDDRRHVLSKPITDRGKDLLESVISQLNNGAFHSEQIAENRRLLRAYLVQEGFASGRRAGFFDIGWRGTVHGLLSDLLLEEEMTDAPLPGFFFGLDADQAPHAAHRTAYFFDKHRQVGCRNRLVESDIYTLLEMFCTADHGTAVGYREDDAGVHPVLEPTWAGRMEAWGLPVVHRTMDAFLDCLTQSGALSEALIRSEPDLRSVSAELLSAFWADPTRAEAQAWGAFPRELGQGREGRTAPLATPYEWTALFCFARHGEHAEHLARDHELDWPHWALAQSTPWLQRSIRLASKGHRAARRAVRAVLDY